MSDKMKREWFEWIAKSLVWMMKWGLSGLNKDFNLNEGSKFLFEQNIEVLVLNIKFKIIVIY